MMSMERLTALLAAYGADPARWPEDERADAEARLAHSQSARDLLQGERETDEFLAALPLQVTPAVDAHALAARIAAAHPRRRGRVDSGARWSFGWPSMATLAAAAVAGFIVGWADLTTVSTASASDDMDLLEIIAPAVDLEDSI